MSQHGINISDIVESILQEKNHPELSESQYCYIRGECDGKNKIIDFLIQNYSQNRDGEKCIVIPKYALEIMKDDWK